jgi:hypothetical protein
MLPAPETDISMTKIWRRKERLSPQPHLPELTPQAKQHPKTHRSNKAKNEINFPLQARTLPVLTMSVAYILNS